MRNFKEETLRMLERLDKRPEDVLFVSDGNTTEQFSEFIKRCHFNYDSGFGGAEINQSLVIVFTDNSWLSRGEYDGSEWWEYHQVPQVTNQEQGQVLLMESQRYE